MNTRLSYFILWSSGQLETNSAIMSGRDTSTTLSTFELNHFLISHGKSALTSTAVLSYSKVIINHQTVQVATQQAEARAPTAIQLLTVLRMELKN